MTPGHLLGGRLARLQDDQGVSLVLGAMLLTGLAMIAFVSYQAQVEPQLQAQAEDQHLRSVSRELSLLTAQIREATPNASSEATSRPIPLGYEVPSLVVDQTVTGSLSFEPSKGPIDLASKRLVAQRINGSDRITQPESWNQVNGSQEIEDVVAVDNLRIKLDRISREMNGDHVAIKVTDADGESAGVFRMCVAKHDPDWDLHYVVKDADGTILYNNADNYFQNQVYEPFWVNALNADYRFDQVLAVAKAPYTLNLSVQHDIGAHDDCPGDGTPGTGTEDLATEYAITYLEAHGTTTVVEGSSGLEFTDWKRSTSSGRLVYEAPGTRGIRQVGLEHGALVLQQSDGAVFRYPPSLSASLADNVVVLEMTIPRLTGESASVTGTSTVSVRANPETPYRVEGQASNLTLNLSTRYPDLWIDRWNRSLDAAGLGGSVFDLDHGSRWARMDVWGLLDPDPSSEQLDLFVRVTEIPARVDLEGR